MLKLIVKNVLMLNSTGTAQYIMQEIKIPTVHPEYISQYPHIGTGTFATTVTGQP
jgi:hypothetical protein